MKKFLLLLFASVSIAAANLNLTITLTDADQAAFQAMKDRAAANGDVTTGAMTLAAFATGWFDNYRTNNTLIEVGNAQLQVLSKYQALTDTVSKASILTALGVATNGLNLTVTKQASTNAPTGK